MATRSFDARNHYPVLKHHTPPPRWGDTTRNNPSVVSGPNSVSGSSFAVAHPARATTASDSSRHGDPPPEPPHFVVLLRKEVIQPHLPVRLPCYDFVPIAGSALDGSLLAVRPPASGVSNFHDVTGGVYKARERIHGCVLTSSY